MYRGQGHDKLDKVLLSWSLSCDRVGGGGNQGEVQSTQTRKQIRQYPSVSVLKNTNQNEMIEHTGWDGELS